MRYARIIQIGVVAAYLFIRITIPANAQTRGAITGRVVAEDGNGLANMTIQISAIGSQSSLRRSTTTDEEGRFRFADLPARSYDISVLNTREYVWAPARVGRRYYQFGENVNFTLIKGGVITGRVTNAIGEPVIGMWVVAIRVRDSEGRPVRGSLSGTSRMTDDRGVYRIFGLSPGGYIVAGNGRSNIFLNFNTSRYDDEAPNTQCR